MNIRVGCFALLLSALSSGPVLASNEVPTPLPVLTEQTPETFQPQIDRIRAGFEHGGRYEYINQDNKETVNQGLDSMLALIRKNGTVAAMSTPDRIALFNAQEKVNAILTHSDSNRLICEKEQQPGSLMRITTCHTYADLRRRAMMTEHELQTAQKNNLQIRSFSAGAGAH